MVRHGDKSISLNQGHKEKKWRSYASTGRSWTYSQFMRHRFVPRAVYNHAKSRDPNMAMLSEAKLVVLDVETTGLSPAMGDRVIELGMIACRGATEITRSSHLINPGRPIPSDAQRVHGISDHDVSECPPFKEIAGEVESTLVDSWIVGHNVRFETGFIAMELQHAGYYVVPRGCLPRDLFRAILA